MTRPPTWSGYNLRKHYRKHGHKLACRSVNDYEASSLATIAHGARFTYDDPDTLELRIGYYDRSTNRLTVVTGTEVSVVTHFPPDRGEQYCLDLPNSTYN